MPFAATDFMKCLFHPESSQYTGTTRNKGNFQPIGKYSCCQQQVLRFSTVPNHHVMLLFHFIRYLLNYNFVILMSLLLILFMRIRVVEWRNTQFRASTWNKFKWQLFVDSFPSLFTLRGLLKLFKQLVLNCTFFFKDTKINYRIFFSEDKDPTKAPRLLGNDEEVVPRFTLGLQSRPRRHLVPLPWQLDQYANKDTSNSVPLS